MMLFGSKETFAIETMIEPYLQPPSTAWGRMCIWCDGVSIGDINEEHCGLGAFEDFERMALHVESLWSNEFNDMTDIELWNLLDGLLYGYHGDIELKDDRTLDQMRADSLKYGKYIFLTNWGEQFDRNGKSFIFHFPKGRIKILNRNLPKEKGISLSTSTEAFCGAIEEAVSWFKQQQLILRGARDA